MRRRVVITGMGVLSPIGNTVEEMWKSIEEGKSGVGPITRFDTTDYPSKIAGEVKDFDPSLYMDKRDARKMALFTQYAVAGTDQALKQAGLKGKLPGDRTGVILGNGIGGFEIIEEGYRQLYSKGPRSINPMTIPKLIMNEGPANVAIMNDIHGPCYSIATACASGTDAIGQAVSHVRSGVIDVAVTGGTEGCITRLGVGGFCKINTLSTAYNDAPETACRPFDKTRDGFIIAEGAGILVIEELEHAKKRGANILAEIKGYGASCDAGHITSPDPEGIGSGRSMTIALEDAGMAPEEIDYINAHGTSTPTNDPIETKAIKNAFGDHAYKLKVSSTKSMTGHMVGAAGGIEAIISVLAIANNYFPPTINLNQPEDGCDLDYVANKGVSGNINAVLTDSLGFGGHNGSLIITAYKD